MDPVCMNRFILLGERLIVVRYANRPENGVVDFITYEQRSFRPNVLRAHPENFERLERIIVEWMHFLEQTAETGENLCQPRSKIMVNVPSPAYYHVEAVKNWIVVRFSETNVISNSPSVQETMMPICLAFQQEDFPEMRSVLKEIRVFFQHQIKMQLLEQRMMTQSYPDIPHRGPPPRHVPLFTEESYPRSGLPRSDHI